jgi:hypothetical protein
MNRNQVITAEAHAHIISMYEAARAKVSALSIELSAARTAFNAARVAFEMDKTNRANRDALLAICPILDEADEKYEAALSEVERLSRALEAC